MVTPVGRAGGSVEAARQGDTKPRRTETEREGWEQLPILLQLQLLPPLSCGGGWLVTPVNRINGSAKTTRPEVTKPARTETERAGREQLLTLSKLLLLCSALPCGDNGKCSLVWPLTKSTLATPPQSGTGWAGEPTCWVDLHPISVLRNHALRNLNPGLARRNQ